MYSFFTDLAEKVPTGYFYALSGGSPLQLCRVLNHHNRNKKGKEGKLRIFFIFMLKNRSIHDKVERKTSNLNYQEEMYVFIG